jgi:putative hydrolase of the HAD superfamily
MNKTVQAISFDLWGTLIKSNPKYKPNRIKILTDFIRRKTLTQSRTGNVEDVFRTFEKSLDCYSEVTGKQVPVAESFKTMLQLFGVHACEDNVTELRSALNELLREHPPVILDGVAEALFYISDIGMSIVLCSNTNLITGANLLRTFKDNDMSLLKTFGSNMVFSDDFGFAKPHEKIFVAAINCVGVPSNEVLHVGDNPITDGGATKVGAKFLLVNHEDAMYEIADLPKYLKSIGCKLPSETGQSVGI